MKKLLDIFFSSITILFCYLIIRFYNLSCASVISGIIICTKTIIPALFPFGVAVLFLQNTNAFYENKLLSQIGRMFSLSTSEFLTFVFSLLGGYPIGAKLISNLYTSGKTTPCTARKMLCFCVNGGPAFIISSVGIGMLSSRLIGIALFISHILASFILLIINKPIYLSERKEEIKIKSGFSEAFVNATVDSSVSVLNICFFIILFNIVTNLVKEIIANKYVSTVINSILEVTIGVKNTNNIYLISFLLGFAGICVWMQVFSICKEIKFSKFIFFINRILHGILSVIIFYIITTIFDIPISTFSNNVSYTRTEVHSTQISISIIILVCFFMFCVKIKKISGNIVEDLL